MIRIEKVSTGGNHAPPQALAGKFQVPINATGLTDGDVKEALLHVAHAFNTQAQDITARANREGAPRMNPHANTMASKLWDFTRMNPLVYYGSKTNEDPQE